jgi:hypothetical protein
MDHLKKIKELEDRIAVLEKPSKKEPKPPRKPTAYQLFVSEKLKDASFMTGSTHKERFSGAAKSWKDSKEIPLNP